MMCLCPEEEEFIYLKKKILYNNSDYGLHLYNSG